MDIKKAKIEHLIEEIDEIINSIKNSAQKHTDIITSVSSTYQKSARNLIHYKEFRNHDLRKIQKKLKNLGLSRLANSGGHQLASLLKTKLILEKLLGKETPNTKSGLSIKNGKKLLTNHTKELLGYRSKNRRVRIMVTQPTDAANNPQMVHEMVKSGMNCARINCAHDDPETWKKIINNVKAASRSQGRKIKISMDLAGPKIRTGAITPGPKVRKFRPERDDIGNVVNPALIVFTSKVDEESDPHELPVNPEWFEKLEVDDKITLTDTREKKRILKVIHKTEDKVFVNCYETSYIGTGTKLTCDKIPSLTNVGELPPIEQSILLRTNDFLTIHKDQSPGQPAIFDEDGNILRQAHISCQLPEVFASVKVGEAVLFDDGKIESVITEASSEFFTVKITRAKEAGSKLKAEKGINFPTTDIPISGLTDKDKNDMPFIVEHADIVNFSFVNSKEDVQELIHLLTELNAIDKLSIILKIETQRAFDNLTEILLTAMKTKYIGVMIARGDLAVETGWDNIGRVQKEILSLCNAAHIPVVWATQVLENLAKKGLPSRSEITDATSSLKAECVMLN
ncbi:MAG: pyruvate kinase, partial [bacterium]|nr:pyruvate kinase [bacterium]